MKCKRENCIFFITSRCIISEKSMYIEMSEQFRLLDTMIIYYTLEDIKNHIDRLNNYSLNKYISCIIKNYPSEKEVLKQIIKCKEHKSASPKSSGKEQSSGKNMNDIENVDIFMKNLKI